MFPNSELRAAPRFDQAPRDGRVPLSADYYWFRNHTPDSRMPQSTAEDLAKLTTKLVPDPPSAAYACGCSWQSVRARAPRGR
eukprot:1666724-Pyramimonas_sp.AAC.1